MVFHPFKIAGVSPRETMAEAKPTFWVIQDTREQTPWVFTPHSWCAGSRPGTVATGDYALDGLGHLVAIERKRNTAELAGNFFEDRFERELGRMRAIAHPYVVVESPWRRLDEFPENSGIPQSKRRRLRVTPALLHKRFAELTLAHPTVQWVFCETPEKAQAFARGLFKRVLERYGHI
jgi:hypothetical protein